MAIKNKSEILVVIFHCIGTFFSPRKFLNPHLSELIVKFSELFENV